MGVCERLKKRQERAMKMKKKKGKKKKNGTGKNLEIFLEVLD